VVGAQPLDELPQHRRGMNSSLDTHCVGMGDENAAVSAGRSRAISSGSSVGMVSSATAWPSGWA
jgi:hypothetical protein